MNLFGQSPQANAVNAAFSSTAQATPPATQKTDATDATDMSLLFAMRPTQMIQGASGALFGEDDG